MYRVFHYTNGTMGLFKVDKLIIWFGPEESADVLRLAQWAGKSVDDYLIELCLSPEGMEEERM